MSLIVLYFLHSTSVLSFHIDVVLTLSILVLYQPPRIGGEWAISHYLCQFNETRGQVRYLKWCHWSQSVRQIVAKFVELKRRPSSIEIADFEAQ